MRRIYLDHASTTPLDPEVRRAMLPFLGERFGNASSLHARGEAARRAIDEARASVGALLGADAGEIVFTSSATEANNLALKGIALAAGGRGGRFVAPATEHISVLHPLRSLERQGFRVILLPVDAQGLVEPEDLRRAITPDTLLVSLGHASGEIGTVQPLAELCRLAHREGVPVHTDAALTAGALPWPEGDDAPDLVTLTPHLFYGPQGIGALRVRQGLRLLPLIEGGAQEGGRRAGTESLAAIIGFGAAAHLASSRKAARSALAAGRAERLHRLLLDRVEDVTPTGHPFRRLPGHLSLCAGGVEAEALLRALDQEGVEAASGSPCTTEVRKPSHVLAALGVDPFLARGALVFTFGEENREDDPEEAAGIIAAQVERLRRMSPISN